MNRFRLPVAALALLTVGLAGCASSTTGSSAASTTLDGSGIATTILGLATLAPGATAAAPGAATTAAATTVPETTAAATTAPTTTLPNPCAGEPTVPKQTTETNSIAGDFDGDGTPDQLTVYGLGTADGLVQWHAHLKLAHGPYSDVALDDAAGTDVGLLGTVQVDAKAGDASGQAAEALVNIGRTADGFSLDVLGTDPQHCLIRFGDGLGGVANFPVRTAGTHRDGLRCDGTAGEQFLVQLSADPATAATATTGATGAATTVPLKDLLATKDTKLQRVGSNLIPETVVAGTVKAGSSEALLYGGLDCPGIAAPS